MNIEQKRPESEPVRASGDDSAERGPRGSEVGGGRGVWRRGRGGKGVAVGAGDGFEYGSMERISVPTNVQKLVSVTCDDKTGELVASSKQTTPAVATRHIPAACRYHQNAFPCHQTHA